MKGKSFFTAFIVLVLLGVLTAYAYIVSTASLYEDQLAKQEKLTNQAYEELVNSINADTNEYSYTVLINPVFGGMDKGDSADGLDESEVALAVAQYVSELNIDESLRIILTRTTDTNPTVRQRQSIATYANPDIIIELECSGDMDNTRLGAFVQYDDKFYNYKLTNVDLADTMLRNIVTHTGTKADGLYTGYESIFANNIPTVSISIGFLSNQEERQALNSDAYRQNIALGILDGIKSIRELD